MKPCDNHIFAVPLSWRTDRPAEWKAFVKGFKEIYGTPQMGFLTYPPLCPKCYHFEFKPDLLTRNLRGSVRGKPEEEFLKEYNRRSLVN